MARVVVTFEDTDDGQIVTYDSSTGTSMDADSQIMTDAEQLASTSIILLQEYLADTGAKIEFASRETNLN
jgi:hypothetical protein